MERDRDKLEDYSSLNGEDMLEGTALVSRRQALKLAGVAILGGALGLLGWQETAEARRRRLRLSASS
jgi:hypothetical protein